MLRWLSGALGWRVLLALVSVVGNWSSSTSTPATRLSVVGVAAGGMGATLVPVHYQDLYRQS